MNRNENDDENDAVKITKGDIIVFLLVIISIISVLVSVLHTTIQNNKYITAVDSKIESKYPLTYTYIVNTTRSGLFKTDKVIEYTENTLSDKLIRTLVLETEKNKISTISSDVTLIKDDIILEPQTVTTKNLIDMDNELGKRDIKVKNQSIDFSIGYKTVTLLDTNNIVWTITTDNQNANDEHTIIIK